MKKKTGAVTQVVLCPKYKKRYEMEIVSFTGQVNAVTSNKVITKFICPACGEFHTVEA